MLKMSFNHEKILNVLKSSLYKITKKEILLSIKKKNLSRYIEKVTLFRNTNEIIQNFKLSTTVKTTLPKEIIPNENIAPKLQEDTPIIRQVVLTNSQWRTEISKVTWTQPIYDFYSPFSFQPVIVSQIKHILTSIEEAQTDSSFQARVGAFITYIHKVPGARTVSVKVRSYHSLYFQGVVSSCVLELKYIDGLFLQKYR